jgi:NAD kinase
VPPVMAFHLGSLGFLTPFEFVNFEEQMINVLEGNSLLMAKYFDSGQMKVTNQLCVVVFFFPFSR